MGHDLRSRICAQILVMFWLTVAAVAGCGSPGSLAPGSQPSSPDASGSASSHEAQLIEAARKEGQVMFYTSTNVEDLEAEITGFKKKYPFIQAEYVRAPADKIIERLLAEARASQYLADVFAGNATKAYQLQQAGLLAKYESPERAVLPDWAKDQEGYWAATDLGIGVLAYNTNLVKGNDIPKSYDDLLDSKWAGKKLGLYQLDGTFFLNTIQAWGEEKALQWWRSLAKQQPTAREGMPLVTQLLAAGEFPIAVRARIAHIEQARRKGAPVDWVRTAMVHAEVSQVSVMARAPHPNAARLLEDFLLSREGQEIISAQFGSPARPGVGGPGAEMVTGVKLTALDPALGPQYEMRLAQMQEILGLQLR